MASSEVQTQFPGLMLPEDYHPILDVLSTEHAFEQLTRFIDLNLETEMNLHRVSAPLFVQKGTGINDELNGVEHPVSFKAGGMGGIEAEVVQSLAKWKRIALAEYHLPVHEGIYTNMNAIRADEQPDNSHSLFVDQWDWEKRILPKDRTIAYLRKTVERLYNILLRAEVFIHKQYGIAPILPEKIYFLHTEELLKRYPNLSPEEREKAVVQKYGAVFLIGIGGLLSNGAAHDGRSPDYDDWSTPNEEGYTGLNGDLIIWHPVLQQTFEISSMGIRVDKKALLHQLKLRGKMHRSKLLYHSMLLNDELPLSIGGGIGRSRVGMFLLRKAHIGEISAGLWPEEMILLCAQNGIKLL